MKPAWRWALLGLLLLGAPAQAEPRVAVGSKTFTESVILGELVTRQLSARGGVAATHTRQLGGTRVLWSALGRGEIDVYPEYSGTLAKEIFSDRDVSTPAALAAALASSGVRLGPDLGFANGYALGMRKADADRLGIRRISDLVAHPELRFGLSNEFVDRADGWRGLRAAYQLPQRDVRGLDHDLAYRALAAGDIAVIDLYSTDAEIAYYDLRVLEDDRHHFPTYRAVLLYRADLPTRAPAAVAALESLRGRVDERAMIEANGRAKIRREPEAQVAADLLAHSLHEQAATVGQDGVVHRILVRTREHLALVALSLALALLIGLPLGVLAARRPRLGQGILVAVGLVQTIPSLALLVLMIPLLGIGGPPAIAALFLYSLLPIVRNTATGLTSVPAELRDAARALGLPNRARLRRIELPLASPAILAGIKTSAVINVGTATLGALIGAGGFGQPILTGVRLDDAPLILEGALPAAALALLVQGLFDLSERWLVPRGLRLR